LFFPTAGIPSPVNNGAGQVPAACPARPASLY
jgi:hypothetical protein